MAWVQIGTRKINTALITFLEEEGTDLHVWFGGSAAPLDLHFDEARALWKAMKAEDVLVAVKHGFHTVAKPTSGDVFDVRTDHAYASQTAEKPKAEAPKPAAPAAPAAATPSGLRTPAAPAVAKKV